jgi:iron complex transport system substrate-binding protein
MNHRLNIVTFLLFLGMAPPLFAQTPPKRVVSMAPNLTEIVYDIGAQDLLVGVTDFCKFPPEAQKKEKIGGWINPNYEKILSLKPDLVLTPQFHGKTVDNLKQLNVPVLVQDCQTVEDVLAAYDVLGKALGRETAAAKAKARLAARLEKIRATPSQGAPVSILFVVDRTPGALNQIYGVGPRNFVDSLIRWTGGVNILSDSPISYPLVSKEELLKRDPEVIVNSLPPSPGRPDELARETAVWDGLPALTAVKNHRVYSFQKDEYLIPGPSMVGLGEFLSDIFRKVRAQTH